jgi:type IV pilus assembly protein PilA
MLVKLRQRMAQEESGFTLVELLVVMLILGLLAAIAIPSFFNQRDKAKDADAKSSVRTAQTAIETYATDHDGRYTGATAARLKDIEVTLNDPPGNTLAVNVPSPSAYTVTVTSKTGTNFSITRDSTGALSFGCTAPDQGGCPGPAGDWSGNG